MPFEIVQCEQNSADWYRARLGIPTASKFATVMRAKGRGENGDSKTRKEYLLKLAGEIITGEPMTNYVSAAMERGKEMEAEARTCYAFMKDVDPERVGFIRCATGAKGCSPDSFVGSGGMLEIKTAEPHILLEHIVKGHVPPEHIAQCQGNLWVAEREWIDLAIYWPKIPLYVKRIERDPEFIKRLADAVDLFNTELEATVKYIRAYQQEAA
jgi:hypothetical protein